MKILVNIPIQKLSDLEGVASVLDLMGFDVENPTYVGHTAIAELSTELEEHELKTKLRLICAVVDAPCVSYVFNKEAREIGPNAKREVSFSSIYGIDGKHLKN